MNRIVLNGTEIIVGNGENLASSSSFWMAFWIGGSCGIVFMIVVILLAPSERYEKKCRQIDEIHKHLCGDLSEGSQGNPTQH